MGQVAAAGADRVLVTSDNPRREQPQAIIDEIIAGMHQPEVEADRAIAICRAIVEAEPADVILLAGKGHELYQEIAGVRYPFSDVEQAQAALLARNNQEVAQ
jgi:UDP-N-acetylmuramoyl-L-alanyl-D-glutamate--2,6-diaminopimelate ligase